MKRLLLAATFAAGLAACSSTPTPDPDHGVSPASYRSAIQQADTNVRQLVTKWRDLQAADQARPVAQQLRPASWWAAEIHEAEATERLLADTLLGSTAGVASAGAAK